MPQYSATNPIRVGDSIFYYLPVGIVKVDGVYDKDKGWTVTVTQDIHADSRQRYELSLNQRYPFFDNNATLTTDDKGLLKTVYGSSTDRTVDAIASLIAAAGQALQFGASLPTRSLAAPEYQPFHVLLDPFDPAKRNRSVEGFTISITSPPTMAAAQPEDEVSAARTGHYPGIVTRLAVPFTVTVNGGGNENVGVATVLLPDRRQRYVLTVPRTPLVTSETTIDFANGCIVNRNVKRPSVLYGVLGIPKTILTTLVPIPGAVQTAETTRIQNQINLLKETTELQKLEAAANTTPTRTAKPSNTNNATATPTPQVSP